MHQPTKFNTQAVQGSPAVQCPWPVSRCWLGPQDHEHTGFSHSPALAQLGRTAAIHHRVPMCNRACAHLDNVIMGTAAH